MFVCVCVSVRGVGGGVRGGVGGTGRRVCMCGCVLVCVCVYVLVHACVCVLVCACMCQLECRCITVGGLKKTQREEH